MGKLAINLTLVLAAVGMLLPASGALAASKNRGAVLIDINPGKRGSSRSGRLGANGSDPTGLTNMGGTLYFDAGDHRHGDELWRSDGTRRGTRMVKDIAPGRPGSFPENLTAVGKTLYFTARDGVHGPELWRSNGTARGTRLVKDIVPGRSAYSLGSFTNVGGALFFIATEAPQSGTAQTGLWRSNGTAAGTTFVKNVAFGYPTAVGNILYGAGEGGLWRSDGTPAGTMLAKSFPDASVCAQAVCYLTNVAGTLYFTAGSGIHSGLWRSDGTEAGTTVLEASVAPIGLAAAGRTLYFSSLDYSNSWLWRSDGSVAGTVPITSVGVSPEGDGPWPQITYAGGTVYFVRNGPGWPLMRTDGTESGTKLIRSDIIPRQLTAAGNTLYFEGWDQKRGNELWRSDGTARGTQVVRDIRRGRLSSGISNLTAVRKALFFSANDGKHGNELWRAGPKPK